MHLVFCRTCSEVAWTDEALSLSFMTCYTGTLSVDIGEVGPCDKWLASTDGTFLSYSSPYRSSHWIGRPMNGVSTLVVAFEEVDCSWFMSYMLRARLQFVNVFWINEWRQNPQNKGWKWFTARRMPDIYKYINIRKIHSKLVYVELAHTRPNNTLWVQNPHLPAACRLPW